MKLRLLVTTPGKQEGKAIEIKLPQFLVGRDPQCQLRPASPLISKRHCAVIQRDDKAYIRDFGSTNGTFVNEERVEGEQELKHNDQLKIGPIQFTVSIEQDTPVSPSTKTPAPATKSPAKPAPAKSDTPAPATKASTEKASAEDDIAAMLLSLEEGETSPSSSGGVPDGSTVFDLKVAGGGDPNVAEPPKPAEKPKGPSGDTRSAAANLLEKMIKRPRNNT
jgi:pSer/pThr/pTyr-binding forkhead associated (FHA) protein